MLTRQAQATLGWIAGCAWTDVAVDVFPTLAMEPTPLILFVNLSTLAGFTMLSCAFIVSSGVGATLTDENLTKREEVRSLLCLESVFTTGRASFL